MVEGSGEELVVEGGWGGVCGSGCLLVSVFAFELGSLRRAGKPYKACRATIIPLV